jgi:hypothetical protein
MLSLQSRVIRFYCLPWLAASLLSVDVLADEQTDVRELPGKTLPNYTREIDSGSFESIKYGKGFKVKGWRLGEGIYFGGVKVDGEYGPGLVFDRGGYVWGFNHERVEFRLKF